MPDKNQKTKPDTGRVPEEISSEEIEPESDTSIAENGFYFQGFGIPESNYFKMPNEWTDITAKIKSIAEIKVVEYILRHTWGFQEYGVRKRITTDEFVLGRKRKDGLGRMDDGTGLDAKSVRSGLRKAVEHGLIIEEVDARDKARIKKYYLVRIRKEGNDKAELEEVGDQEGDISPQMGKIFPPDRESFPPRGVKLPDRSKKETLERNLRKKDSNRVSVDTNPSFTSSKEPSSEAIAFTMRDLTDRHLHDTGHTKSNITQAINLWRKSRLTETEFIQLLHEAKSITLSRSGGIRMTADGFLGQKNRAPYFFKVLRGLLLEQMRKNLAQEKAE